MDLHILRFLEVTQKGVKKIIKKKLPHFLTCLVLGKGSKKKSLKLQTLSEQGGGGPKIIPKV